MLTFNSGKTGIVKSSQIITRKKQHHLRCNDCQL